MTVLKSREPGGELNLKAKRRWEILRRTDNYRRDWDTAFAQMMEMLKSFPILEAEDLGCEPDPEKMREATKKITKDAQTWEDFLEKKFQRDWSPSELKEEFLYSNEELADKYGLILPYKYDDPLWDPYIERMKSVFKDMEPVRMISHNRSSYKFGPDRKVIFDHTPNLRDKRWLTIEIDLHTDSLKTIWDMLKSIIEFYRPLCSPFKIKKRGAAMDFYLETEKGKVSIYELWDMNKKEGKSPWQITQELYPDDTYSKHYQPDNKNYDKDIRNKWKQIDDAIKKADKEINPPL